MLNASLGRELYDMPAAPDILIISPGDSVAVAIRTLRAGEEFPLDGTLVRCLEDIPPGHKMAIRPVDRQAQVLKCGVPIGLARRPIETGEHVHTHNLVSTYIADH